MSHTPDNIRNMWEQAAMRKYNPIVRGVDGKVIERPATPIDSISKSFAAIQPDTEPRHNGPRFVRQMTAYERDAADRARTLQQERATEAAAAKTKLNKK